MTSLLDLPRYIREHIWELVLARSPDSFPHILTISRQLYTELLPYMFRRPVTFESQQDLYSWLSRVQPSVCRNVDALSFCLKRDGRTSPGVSSSDGSDSAHITSMDQEIEKVKQALQSLPGITSLALYKDVADQSADYWALYDGVMGAISSICPMLRSFAAHTDTHKLDFLRHLPALERLQFTGFAASSPMETKAVLSHLRHLTDIEIMPALRNPGALGSSTRDSFLKPCLSREVLRSLRLHGVRINESQALNSSAPDFWKPTMINALSSLSRHSLTRFEVVLEDFSPNAECITLFCAFLKQSHIQDLIVEWEDAIGVNSEILNALPQAVVKLQVGRCDDSTACSTLLDQIRCLKEDNKLSSLREIIVKQKRPLRLNAQDADFLQGAIDGLGQINVKAYCL